MATNTRLNFQTFVFIANGSSPSFFWPGGEGVLACQGDLDGSTLALQALLGFSKDGINPDTGTFATVTDEVTADTIVVTDPGATSSVRAIKFVLPPCWVKMTAAGGTTPDGAVGAVGRSSYHTD